MPLSHCDTWIVYRQWAYSVQRVPDCLGGLSRVGISSRSTRPWNGQPPSICKKNMVQCHFTRTIKTYTVKPLYSEQSRDPNKCSLYGGVHPRGVRYVHAHVCLKYNVHILKLFRPCSRDSSGGRAICHEFSFYIL